MQLAGSVDGWSLVSREPYSWLWGQDDESRRALENPDCGGLRQVGDSLVLEVYAGAKVRAAGRLIGRVLGGTL